MAEKTSKRTWLTALIAAITIVCVLVVALIGTSAYFIASACRSPTSSATVRD
jgi:hypothetical protein